MKHQSLIQAIGQLDDSLIEEAHAYRAPSRRIRTYLPRIGALAACFLLIFAGAWFSLRSGSSLSLDGTDLLDLGTGSVEFSLTPATQQRSAVGVEIPLDVEVGRSSVQLTAGSETAIVRDDATCTSLTLTENAHILWHITPMEQDTFQLCVTRDGETIVITAAVSPNADSLILTVSR